MTPQELSDLHRRCFVVPRPYAPDEFSSLLATPSCFLCETDGGFAMGRAVAGEAELLTLAVDPDRRREGLGRDLLRRFEETAADHGAETAFLEVAAGNVAARALYAKAGWQETGRRKSYYRLKDGQFEDAIAMRKPLLPA